MARQFYEITPSVLKWHRENARLSLDDLPKDIQKYLEPAENGSKTKLTYKQLTKVSEKFSVFTHWLIMDKIPDNLSKYEVPIKDFRTGVDEGIDGRDFSSTVIKFIKNLNGKMSWARATLEEDGQEPLEFVGKFDIKNDTPEEVASYISDYFNIKSAEEAKDLKVKIEAKGVFAWSYSHSSYTIDPKELRGFAVADNIAPYIYYNANDYPNSQKFTIIHELAHILIGVDGISNNIDSIDKGSSQDANNTEYFCNKVAATVLMPASRLEEAGEISSQDDIKELAKDLGVSSIALLIRLYSLEKIGETVYVSHKDAFEREYREYKKPVQKVTPGKKSAGNFHNTKQSRDSRSFNIMVYGAYADRSISLRDAFALVGVTKNSSWSKLEAKYKYIPGRE